MTNTPTNQALTAIKNNADILHIASLVDRTLRVNKPKSLLAFGDAKSSKGEALGYRTGVLYLAPHYQSGFNVCPKASPGCSEACLYTAGRGAMTSVQLGRLRKTRFLMECRNDALSILRADITKLIRYCDRHGMKPAVRLNGTSDLPWQSKNFGALPEIFPDVQFYGYTKILKNLRTQSNYHQTFSLSEDNAADARKALEMGYNIAVVFDELPDTFWGRPVVDGDKHDLTFLHPAGTVIGLKAKGAARRDTSGFVQLTRKGA